MNTQSSVSFSTDANPTKKESRQMRYENPYIENGFKDRKAYLNSLKDEYGADVVNALISVLPPSEDFDGLVSELQDYCG